jgi:hypothetical protein
MKTKIVMAMSIAGVLVAGSAAALVNTNVLDSSASPAASVGLATTHQSTPTSTGSESSVVTTSVVAGGAVAQTTVPASASQAVYSIGTSGTVTLDTAGDVLTIVGVTPASGWVVTKSETEDATNVEVKLQAGNVEVEFHANLLFGVVTTSFESHGSSGPDNSVTDNSVTDNSVTDNSVTGSSVEDNHGGSGSDDNGGDDNGGDDNSGHGGGGDDD